MNTYYDQLIKKLKNYRISIFKTQDDVSFESNLSLRTVVNIEKGENVSMENFIKYIDCLGLLNSFINFPPVSDMRFEDIPYGKYQRTRAQRNKTKIKWGDEM